MVNFMTFVGMGRHQWRGQASLAKKLFFLLFGTPDIHTRLRNSYVLNRIAALDLPEQCRVLDGGFGRGITLFELSRRHPRWYLTGVELDPVMARSAQAVRDSGHYENLQIIEGSIETLDEQSRYDLIISMDILEHIEDDVAFLQRYLQALRPGGYLVLHVPKRHQMQWRLIPAFHEFHVESFVRDPEKDDEPQVRVPGHVRDEYTREEIQQVVKAAGFKIMSVQETVGKLGEVAFELNQLFWPYPALRYLLALLTFPVTLPLGYWDTRQEHPVGNSLLVVAAKA